MSLSNDSNGNGMVMPVAPMYGGGYGGGNGWGFGNDGGLFWLLVLFLFGFAGNGWGNGFGGGAGGVMPYMMTGNIDNGVQRGFDQNAVMTGINGINNAVTTGFGNVQTALCSGFGGVNQAISNGFAQAEIANNARQMADMQQNFGMQTAMGQGFNGVTAGISDLRYTEATEACATRNQSAQNTRDIIDAVNRGNQGIMDKLCALELDGVKNQLAQANRENTALQNQVNMATFRESQANQNALFQQGLANEVDALYNRLNNCPVPTTPVYGRTPIFTCNNNGCGCGCGNGFAN